MFVRATAGETIVGEEWRLLRPDRTLLDVTVNAAAVRDDGGRPTAVVVSITDSSERRRAESTLRESEERLRAIVGSTFDGMVAIDGEGRILEFNAAAEALFRRSRAEVIGHPVQILMPQRLRSAHAAAIAVRREAPTKKLSRRLESVGIRGDGTEFPVEISVTALLQRGRAMYVASLRDLTSQVEAESARVYVRDHGPGLPPEELRRVWERFHRSAGVRTQNGTESGLGLGLYICRGIVEIHGGSVDAQSTLGQGCTFSFTLPRLTSGLTSGLSSPAP